MQRLEGSARVPDRLRGAVVALGNFDGFHLGHQAVVGRAVERARQEARPVLVATFDPHPVRFFRPETPPFRLTTLDQRERLFKAAGADGMIVFQFDAALAAVTAEAFVAEWLVDRIGASAVVTGEDFTFGAKRAGTVAAMAALGAELGLATEAVGPVSDGFGPISSSRIRAALAQGNPEEATRLLTRPFAIEGIVQHGDKLGRTIGYPTANLTLGGYLRPAYGIYAVRGRLPDGRLLDGAANIGIRPTFDPPKELLEPHFFDFDGDLYGQCVEIQFVSYIRPEMKFDDLDGLMRQMDADCIEARHRLAATPPVA